MASVTKPVLLNETGEQIVEAINKVAEAIGGNSGGNNSGGGLPSGGEPHQMLVTNEDAETVWEERTHYKSQERISLVCDEENEFNISNEDGDVVLYHAYGGSFGPGAHNQYYIEYTDMYGDDMRAYLTKAEHGGNMTLVNDSNASGECIYVIDDIPGDSVTINGHTFTNYGIYAPSSIYVVNQGGDHESVELNEIVGVSYHQLDPNYIPDEAKLPDGGGENMMLVTDSDGNTEWQERTHWKDEGLMDVLPETYAELDEDAGSFLLFEPFSMEMELGKTYIVTYNGETYTCVAKEFDMDGISFVAVGNMGLFGGEESAEPFCLVVVPDEMSAASGGAHAMMMVNDGSTEATIQIQYDGVVYHKLDPGYMPFAMKCGTVDILPETTLEGEDGQFPIVAPFAGKIVVGETYTVTYDGTDYTCMAFPVQENEDAPVIPILGNQVAAGGEDTGEPFLISYFPPEIVSDAEAYGFVVHMSGLITSVTVRVQGVGGDVKIDNSALDMDWVAKYDNVGETIVAETIGRGINVECPGADTAFFVEGATFIAYVDNVRYGLTVVNYEGELAAGNLGLAAAEAPGNGEPFYVVASSNGGLLFSWGVTGDMSASHTVSAYLPGSSQRVANQKVPDAFFPDIRPFYVNVTYKSDGHVADKTYDEICGAHNANRVVCCKLMSGGVEYVLYYTGVDQAKAWFFAHRGERNLEVSIDANGTVTVT